MSSVFKLYQHHLKTWEAYPRVYYFRGRFIDFYKRFSNVIGRLPDDVKDNDLLSSIKCLHDALEENNIINFVLGKYDLPIDELFISTQSVRFETPTSTSSLPSIVICYSKVNRLEEGYLEEITQILTQFKSSNFYESFPMDLLIIACKIHSSISVERITTCLNEIQMKVEELLGFKIERENIIISSAELNIKERISCLYEKRIIDAFVGIRVFFGHFVKKSGQTRSSFNQNISFMHLFNTVSDILKTPFYLLEGPYDRDSNKRVSRLLIARLARHIRINFINLSASKHSLPTWFCTRLCNSKEVENELIGSFSIETRYMLYKLGQLLKRMLKKRHSCAYLFRTLEFSLMTLLQRDFERVTSLKDLEKNISDMKRISTVMGKMEYEIDGYLKQTIVKHFDFSKKQLSLKLPDGLRRSVLQIDGVYGIGIIYDTIEVHLQHTLEDAEKVNHVLELLMREYHLQNSYRVRQIKSEVEKRLKISNFLMS